MRPRRVLRGAWLVGLLLNFMGSGAPALTMKEGTAWPDPVISVCWEDPRKKHAQEREIIRKAVEQSWGKESAIRFVGWRSCSEGDRGIRIAFDRSYPRTRGRGVEIDGLERGMILPSLWSLAALSVNLKAPVHEFGHALGFGHEHARRDAPDPERCAAKGANGERYVEADQPVTPFDYDSIMVACISVATKNFSVGVPRLSASDIFGLIRTYGSNPDNVLDRDEPGDRFGAALLVRDFDGDGDPDLTVGAPGEDGGAGAVYLYRGDPVRGFRPWARFSAADFGVSDDRGQGFGSGLAWRAPSGDEAFGRLIVHANGSEDSVAFALATAPGEAPKAAGLYSRAEPPVQAASPAKALRPILATGFGFPDLSDGYGRDLQVLHQDLDGDGAPETVIGAPRADASAKASGVVVVLRGRKSVDGPNAGSEEAAAWYWFGQAY